MSEKEIARNANRLERAKEIVSERKEEHMSKEMGVRKRSFYDEPDYDVVAEFSDRTSTLIAPAMPGFVQRWISKVKNNGSHLNEMLNSRGWSLRDPMSVPSTAGLNTTKWGEYDTISAGNELVLCYMRRDIYETMQSMKAGRNSEITNDRAGFGQDLHGVTRSERDGAGNQYARVAGAYSKTETVFNDKPF